MRAFAYYQPATVIEPQRVQIVVPAFLLDVPVWASASGILAEAPFGNVEPFSLKLPIEPFGENFIAAIRWMEDDIFVRYVLFDHPDAVLFYPLYNGEQIGLDAVLEIWSVERLLNPQLDVDYALLSSEYVFPAGELASGSCNSCCQNPQSVITLAFIPPSELPPGAECNPFCGNLCSTEPPMPVCECPIVVVETVADGRAYTPDIFISPAIMITQGGATKGDGLGKSFNWDATSVAADDGSDETAVIRPNNIDAGSPGRWLQTSLG